MRAAFETLDKLHDVKDCPDIDEGATTIMAPLWRGTIAMKGVKPAGYLQYRRYERTSETHAGYPLFREVYG